MNRFFVDRWTVMHKYWSVRVGALGVIIMAGVPALSDQFPNIAPSLVAWFPKHGQQVVPIIGAVIAIAARIVSQQELIARLRGMFHREPPHDQ